jgi:diadenosine tetraphosphate (Ap4A) HIT family hydrolase
MKGSAMTLPHIKEIFPELPQEINKQLAPWTELVREDFHVAVFADIYPVTPGHLLFVPKFNTVSILMDAMRDAVQHGQAQVESGLWDGFNIGMNYGSAAGQTVAWPHVHLIPRRAGDVEDPIGGVRNTIPGQGNYRTGSYKHPGV